MSDPIDTIAKIGEIIIAMGTIFSLWFAKQALKRSDWNAAMITAPSLTCEPSGLHLYIDDSEKLFSGGGGPVHEVKEPKRVSVIQIKFPIRNEGRGVALNICGPKITISRGNFGVNKYYDSIPLSIGVGSDPIIYEIEIRITNERLFEEKGEGIAISFSVDYTNDQGNILCQTSWRSTIKPYDFDEVEKKLVTRDHAFVESVMKVTYQPK